ncbi:AtpZ/AtpI family protein [Paenibacillus daejeonensis]|uniref:AtpZ/AtpI family protein n=1 Tax=Paenibacillus daejeonensis TaxID=135193 RepID=UPI00036EA2CC|nr:AtpZ/AtpI family protein [Paenibacillus daejeonensis]
MTKKSNQDSPWRAAGMVGAMGIDLAVCIYLGYLVGNWLGSIVTGVLVGLAVGIYTCILILKRVVEDTNG